MRSTRPMSRSGLRAAPVARADGGAAQRKYFRNALGWSNLRTTVVDVGLRAGANTITFGNASAYVPDLDLIQIAAPVG